MKAVLDTNVVISACFWRGPPFDCLAAWARKRYKVVLSAPLVAEYQEVFAKLSLEYPDRKPVNWVDALEHSAELVFPTERAMGVTEDPFDEMILECALAAEADFIVTGDKKHLLPLEAFRGIPILKAVDFLKRVTA